MGKRERPSSADCRSSSWTDGKYISMSDVAECSYRIIMATEIIGLSTEERQVIASAVRYNTREFGCYEEINRETSMNRENYLLTAKLTAILRLANAHGQKPLPEGKSSQCNIEGQNSLSGSGFCERCFPGTGSSER